MAISAASMIVGSAAGAGVRALSALVLIGVMLWVASIRLSGLESLRRDNPGAIVLPVTVGADQSEILRAAGTVTAAFRPPMGARVVFARHQILYWTGRRPRLAAEVKATLIQFTVESYRTVAGEFPVLSARVHQDERVVTLMFFPLRATRSLIARQVPRQELMALAEVLNESESASPQSMT